MSKIRSEKTKMAERNAHLVEACDPEEISKVRQELELALEEKELLESDLKGIQIALETHQQKNLDLREQLDRTSDPQIVTQIDEKMKRYKQERDIAKKQMASLKEKMEMMSMDHSNEIQRWQEAVEELKNKKRKYRESCKRYEQINESLTREMREKDELIAFLQDIVGDGQGEEEEFGEEWRNEEEDEVGGDTSSDKRGGVSYLDSSRSPQLSLKVARNSSHLISSTHSLPATSEQQRKPRSGIILTSTSKASSAHRGSQTSLGKTGTPTKRVEKTATPTSSSIDPVSLYSSSSLDVNHDIITVSSS